MIELYCIYWIRKKMLTKQGNKKELRKYSKFLITFSVMSFFMLGYGVFRANQLNGGVWELITIAQLGISLMTTVTELILFVLMKKYCEEKIDLKRLIDAFKPLSVLFLLNIILSAYMYASLEIEMNGLSFLGIIFICVAVILMFDTLVKSRKIDFTKVEEEQQQSNGYIIK